MWILQYGSPVAAKWKRCKVVKLRQWILQDGVAVSAGLWRLVHPAAFLDPSRCSPLPLQEPFQTFSIAFPELLWRQIKPSLDLSSTTEPF